MKSYRLREQPRGTKAPIGVSLFDPQPQHSEAQHNNLAADFFGYEVTVTNVKLPSNLRLVRDFELTVPVEDEAGDILPIACGWHWTLYTTKDTSAQEFEAAYDVCKAQLIPCEAFDGAESREAADDDFMPVDRQTYVAVLALENLATRTTDPNTKLFSKLFADHLRAQDMDFKR